MRGPTIGTSLQVNLRAFSPFHSIIICYIIYRSFPRPSTLEITAGGNTGLPFHWPSSIINLHKIFPMQQLLTWAALLLLLLLFKLKELEFLLAHYGL